MALNDAVPSKAFDVLEANMLVNDEFTNGTNETVNNRPAPNGHSVTKTLYGMNEEFNRVIATLGYAIVGDFADVTKATITNDSQVYTSKSVVGFEGYVWRTNQILPYTPTGSDPTQAPELGKWLAVAIGELQTIARSLNVLDSDVIYATDTVTALDDVLYIYDVSQQITYEKPDLDGPGETIVSITVDQLTTTANTYTMREVDNITDLNNDVVANTANIVANTANIASNTIAIYHNKNWLYSDLRISNPLLNGEKVRIKGKLAENDLYDSRFTWDSASILDDDDFNVIKVTAITTGRWIKTTNVPTVETYIRNSNFVNFDRGSSKTLGTANTYFCDAFIGTFTVSGSADMAQANEFTGAAVATNITMSSGEFFYIRQYVLDVIRFSSKVMTMLVELETTMSASYDWYINIRYNDSDVERVNIIDTDALPLKSGRSLYAITFQVPDYKDQAYILNAKNSLELSFRVIADGPIAGETLTVHNYDLIDGSELPEKVDVYPNVRKTSKDEVAEIAYKYYEVVKYQAFNGFVDNNRVRVFFPFSVIKRDIPNVTFDFFDESSNIGKISTYDSAGVRTDDVTPLNVTYNTNGVTILAKGVGVTGIGSSFVVRADL